MAKRQDSGSNAAHEDQRPISQNEDALPEMDDEVRGRADEGDDEEFDDSEMDEVDEEEDEGTE